MSLKLHLFFATTTARALILREAPGPLWRMIGWDRDTHTFEPGQWMKHDLHIDRSSLSPDGAHFIYFAVDGIWDRPAKGAYTVLSAVPNFDPLALYPEGDAVGGGGYFIDDRHYVIQSATGTPDIVGKAKHLHRMNSMRNAAKTPRVARKFAWGLKSRPAEPEKFSSDGGRLFDASGALIADFSDMVPV